MKAYKLLALLLVILTVGALFGGCIQRPLIDIHIPIFSKDKDEDEDEVKDKDDDQDDDDDDDDQDDCDDDD